MKGITSVRTKSPVNGVSKCVERDDKHTISPTNFITMNDDSPLLNLQLVQTNPYSDDGTTQTI